MNTNKGQIEFMAVLGVVAFILIIAYYAYTTQTTYISPVPSGIAQEQKVVIDAVTVEAKNGADHVLKFVEGQGGYFTTTSITDGTAFNQMRVPYWQKCGNAGLKPSLNQIKTRIEAAMKDYLVSSLGGKTDYFGRNVSLDLSKMVVKATIFDDKIDFVINVTGRVNGYALQTPAAFSVPTKLGKIYEFASNFVQENANKRFIEHYTITTMYMSDGENGGLYTQGGLTQCGDNIYQSGAETNRGIYNSIKYTLANTGWWQPMRAITGKSKYYTIESVMGRTYPQFEIGLYMPDGFAISGSGSLSVSNDKYAAQGFIFTITQCFATYDWKYSADFPVIVSVKDVSTGNRFNFAFEAAINSMLPGTCSLATSSGGGSGGGGGGTGTVFVPATATATISAGGSVTGITVTNQGSGYTSTPVVTIAAPTSGTAATAAATMAGGSVTGITVTNGGSGYTSAPIVMIYGSGSGTGCDAADSYARIFVLDQSGSPLVGATASYNGCALGTSDSAGMILSPISGGSASHTLFVSKIGYDAYAVDRTSADINNTYSLYKRINMTLNISYVDINAVDNPHGAPEPSPNTWQGQLTYNRCRLSPASDSVLVNLTSGRASYMVTNVDTHSTVADCSLNADCVACDIDSTNTASCNACLVCRASGFTYRSYSGSNYVTGGSYAVNAQAIVAGTSTLRGAFMADYSLPYNDKGLRMYIPMGGGDAALSDLSVRVAMAGNLTTQCAMNPVVENTTTYSNVIRMTGCSPSQLRAMIRNELGSCINTAQLDNLFQASSTLPTATWIFKTTKADVLAAIRGCGYDVSGC